MAQAMLCDGGCGQVAHVIVQDTSNGEVLAFESLCLGVWAITVARVMRASALEQGIDWPGLTDQIMDAPDTAGDDEPATPTADPVDLDGDDTPADRPVTDGQETDDGRLREHTGGTGAGDRRAAARARSDR